MHLIGKSTVHCNDGAVHGCSIANMRIFVECWRPRRKRYFKLSVSRGRTERTRQFRIKCKHEVCDGQGTARSRTLLPIHNFVTVPQSNAFRGPYIEIMWWPHLRLGCVRAGVTPLWRHSHYSCSSECLVSMALQYVLIGMQSGVLECYRLPPLNNLTVKYKLTSRPRVRHIFHG